MKRQNEISAMEGLLQIMPFLTGMTYRCHLSPDEGQDTSGTKRKEVDYILTNNAEGQRSLAVEHTRVEAFRGQMTYVIGSFEIVFEISEHCKGRLPSDRYYILVLPDSLISALKRQAKRRFVEAVAPRIIENAPALKINESKNFRYESHRVLLMCGGSHPEVNSTILRLPERPDDQESRAVQSLWHAIQHGLSKFSKYKQDRYDTILSLQDISGECRTSTLRELEKDAGKKALISRLIDYIVVFSGSRDRMVIGNVWKERELRYRNIPYKRRFDNSNGTWLPLEK
jgi:hypothetical protein